MIAQEIFRGDASSRFRMDDAHLEGVAIEAEVARDQTEEPIDGRVAANGAAATPGSTRASPPLLQTGAIRLLHQPIEATPMGTLQPSLGFGLDHRLPLPFGTGAAFSLPFQHSS